MLIQLFTKTSNGFTPVCDSVQGGLCSGGVSVRGVSVQKVSGQGVSVWETDVQRTQPYGKERAVCILLECILVYQLLPNKKNHRMVP